MPTTIPPEISSNNFLSDLTENEKNTIFQHMQKLTFDRGEIIIHAGEEGNNMYFIESGEVEIFHPMHDKKSECHFGKLNAGNTFGERSLLKDKVRTASVRAMTKTVIYSLDTQLLVDEQNPLHSFSPKIYKNLSNKFGQLLGENNAAIMFSMKRELQAAQIKAAMGSFIVTLLIGLCIFVFVSGLMHQLVKIMGTGYLVTVGMMVITASAFYLLTKSYPFPKATYGFTLVDWKKSLFEGLLFSVLLAFVFTVLKYLIIHYSSSYSGLPLFDSKAAFRSGNDYSASKQIFMALVYIFISSPLQEYLFRGGFQGSLRIFLQEKKHSKLLALISANMVFSMTHIFLSVKLALGAFFVGLFWGWLFSRHQSLLGTVVSHMFIGVFLFFILGIQAFFFK